MEATIKLTKEFKEMTRKKLTTQRKGELRWEKLVKAEKSGALQACKSRADVGRIVGIKDYNSAYTWVFNMIKKKALIETVVGRNGQTFEYEYHTGTKPGYKHNGRNEKKQEHFTFPDKEGRVVPDEPAKTVVYKPSEQVEISYKEATITMVNVGAEYVAEVVKNLCK